MTPGYTNRQFAAMIDAIDAEIVRILARPLQARDFGDAFLPCGFVLGEEMTTKINIGARDLETDLFEYGDRACGDE